VGSGDHRAFYERPLASYPLDSFVLPSLEGVLHQLGMMVVRSAISSDEQSNKINQFALITLGQKYKIAFQLMANRFAHLLKCHLRTLVGATLTSAELQVHLSHYLKKWVSHSAPGSEAPWWEFPLRAVEITVEEGAGGHSDPMSFYVKVSLTLRCLGGGKGVKVGFIVN